MLAARWSRFKSYPDLSLTFSNFPIFSLTTMEFPDFSRFSKWVVTLYPGCPGRETVKQVSVCLSTVVVNFSWIAGKRCTGYCVYHMTGYCTVNKSALQRLHCELCRSTSCCWLLIKTDYSLATYYDYYHTTFMCAYCSINAGALMPLSSAIAAQSSSIQCSLGLCRHTRSCQNYFSLAVCHFPLPFTFVYFTRFYSVPQCFAAMLALQASAVLAIPIPPVCHTPVLCQNDCM